MKYERQDLATVKVAQLNALFGTLGPDVLGSAQVRKPDGGARKYKRSREPFF
jgi:hypothetical protein